MNWRSRSLFTKNWHTKMLWKYSRSNRMFHIHIIIISIIIMINSLTIIPFWENVNRKIFFRYPDITHVVVRSFVGTVEEAQAYLAQDYYIGLTGFLCKVSSTVFFDTKKCSNQKIPGQIRQWGAQAVRVFGTASWTTSSGVGRTVHVSKHPSVKTSSSCEGGPYGQIIAVLA